MWPSYRAAVSLHRFLVKFVAVLGIIMLATGATLEFPSFVVALLPFVDVEVARLIHRKTALFFAPTFATMLTVGLYMYFYPAITRIFGNKTGGEKGANKIKLVKKETVAKGTMSFYFAKPLGFDFVAGQHLEWTEIDPPETDAEGENRTFTICAAPFEKHLVLTTRMRDTAYKRVLKKMLPGHEIQISGREGDFVLAKENGVRGKRSIVMMAGGIGITPFRSMILQARYEGLPYSIYLFYSNRTPEDAAFLTELKKVARENSEFHLIPTFTETKAANAEFGYIDAKMIRKYLKDYKGALYYIAGPPAMVTAMKEMLGKMKVPSEQILTDSFTGY